MRYFNVSGPCNKEDHYMIEASTRLQGVEQLIDMKQYFVIHAARQSGTTTYLKDLAERLNRDGKYYQESLEQAARYVDVFGSKEGWLVLFDQRTGVTWEEKIYCKQENVDGTIIHVFGN